jgi:hypothetical protein
VRAGPPLSQTFPRKAPIWHCSGWGLPCRPCCQGRGGLLLHRFTIAADPLGLVPSTVAVFSLWRFPWGYPRWALPSTLSSWSPDFPRRLPSAIIQPSARGMGYPTPRQPSTAKRCAKSAARAASQPSTLPCAQGRKRKRKAVSSAAGGASG